MADKKPIDYLEPGARRDRATRLATRAGLSMAALSLFTGVPSALGDPEIPGPMRALSILWVPAFSFAFFFAVVFPLAYAFPPTGDRFDKSLRFAGARRVVWPLILVMVALVFWYALSAD